MTVKLKMNPSYKSKPFVLKEENFRTNLGKELLKNPPSDPAEIVNQNLIMEPLIADLLFPDLKTEIVSTAKVCHTLRAGKIYRFSIAVLVGNKKGVIGLGVGKHKFKDKAITKALNNAKKNLVYLKNKEIKSETETEQNYKYSPTKTTKTKVGATVIEISPLLSETVTASKLGQIYCALGGFSSIKISTEKKAVKSKMNYYKALHQAIILQTKDE